MTWHHNAADKCATCGHAWHGFTCSHSTCVCPTAWVEPAAEVAEPVVIAHTDANKGRVGSKVIRALLGRQIESAKGSA